MRASEFTEQFRIKSRGKFRLRDHDPRWAGPPALKALKSEEVKAEAKEMLEQSQRELSTAQELLYANDRYSLLIVLQGMDASGKDGTIKHVMTGVSPAGCQVFSFKKPTPEEY